MAQKLYEAMFVVDSNKAREDFEQIEGTCLKTITRHGGEIAKSVKWDDRKMTFEINKVRRGTYILVHFNAESTSISKIDRQIQLSDNILRCLITVDEDGVDTETGTVAKEKTTDE